MDVNGYPCGEFGEHCICLGEVRELASKLTCVEFTTRCLLPAVRCQVQVLKVDVLLVYCPSLTLLDIVLIPTIADYCGQEHHGFETGGSNQDV
jgi:hypothetical protein